MNLTKAQRQALLGKFHGKCAYCGSELGARWHADHLEPVQRRVVYQHGKGFVPTGEVDWPERDCLENLMPACPPCNIDKHSMSLKGWRQKLENATAVLSRNNPTYRHAIRFGLLAETDKPVIFYFESLAAPPPNVSPQRAEEKKS